MKYRWKFRSLQSALLLILLLSVVYSGCTQYDYSSPLPGIIEVRLKTISHNIPFDPLNNFVIKVSRVEAIRDDGARTIIYEDLKAIQRTTNVYNTLDFRARDSALVMGESYAPPGHYVAIQLQIEAADAVIRDGYLFALRDGLVDLQDVAALEEVRGFLRQIFDVLLEFRHIVLRLFLILDLQLLGNGLGV